MRSSASARRPRRPSATPKSCTTCCSASSASISPSSRSTERSSMSCSRRGAQQPRRAATSQPASPLSTSPRSSLLFPEATIEPQLDLPPGAAIRVADREDARVKLARGHMEVVGPITSAATQQALRPARRRPRVRPAPARGAGRDHARTVHPGRAQRRRRVRRPRRQTGRRVLRPPPARTHPPLHDRPPARRNRAGLGPALPPLPAALAASHPRYPAPGQGRRSRGDSSPAGLRGARRRLGARPARAPRPPTTAQPGSTNSASPAT